MSPTPIETVKQSLADPTNPEIIRKVVAQDATYVSLNRESPELKKLLPWAGTSKGPQAFIDTFTRVFRYGEVQNLQISETFETGENVAVFGTFTFKSRILGKVVTSLFAILAKVREQKIVYFQFMEDTFATASTFRVSGSWRVHNDPEGEAFEV